MTPVRTARKPTWPVTGWKANVQQAIESGATTSPAFLTGCELVTNRSYYNSGKSSRRLYVSYFALAMAAKRLSVLSNGGLANRETYSNPW
jgi:hypothetical protein